MKKLISNIAIIIALVVSSVSYSNAQVKTKLYIIENLTQTSPVFEIMCTQQLTDLSNYFIFKQQDTVAKIFVFEELASYFNYQITHTGIYKKKSFDDIVYDENTQMSTMKINMKKNVNETDDKVFTFILKTTAPVTASVKEVEVSNFSVYPNPVVDVLNIKFDAYEDVDVVVMDMSGRIVYNEPTSTMTTVNMSDQPSGMYLVKIGNQTQTFIKK